MRVAEGLGVGAHLGQLAGCDQQGLDSFDKTVTGQVLFLDDDCRTGLLQLKGIVILVVFGHVRAGDQHRCAAHSLELGQRQCAGAGNDEICRGQQLGHVVDILRHDEVLAGGKALFLFQPFKQLDAAAAGGVQVKHVPVRLLFPGAEVGHDLIDAVRTETAAEAQNHGAVSGVQLGARCGAVRGQHLGADRVAHDGGLFRRAELFNRVRAGGQHNVDLLRQQLVGHAREGVLLMDGCLDAAPGCRANDGSADVAAAADDKVGLDLVQNLPGARAGQRQMPDGYDVAANVFQAQMALEAVDLNVMEGVACLGDKAVLHPLAAARKVDLRRRVRGLQGTGNRQRRIDVTGCTAGSN